MMNGGPISWSSRRQATVATSSTQAEYVSLTATAKEATWYRLLMTELRVLDPTATWAEIKVRKDNECVKAVKEGAEKRLKTANKIVELGQLDDTRATEDYPSIELRGDNQGSIALNPVLHSRSKHIDIQHHYIRDEVTSGRINLTYISSEEMVADGLTKPLSNAKLQRFLRLLSMR